MTLSAQQYSTMKAVLRAQLSSYVFDGLARFPSSVTPAVWLDGTQQAYSDAAGLLPVNSGLIRRLNEPTQLGGSWVSPSDNERPIRDGASIRLECIGAAGGYSMTRVAVGGVVMNACTLVASFVARDSASGGSATMGLIQCDDTNVGIRMPGDSVWVYNGGGNWFTTLRIVQGVKNTIIVRYTPTGIDAMLNAGGVITIDSTTSVIPATAVSGAWRVGQNAGTYLYGSVTQAFAVARAVTNIERIDLMTWVHAQVAPVAYPDDRALIAYVGDSITRALAANYSNGYAFRTLLALRTTKPLTENCDTAVSGSGVGGALTAGAGNAYYDAKVFYSASRIKNVMVIMWGTNDLATGATTSFVLTGVGAPSVPNSGLYPICDDARARGWKVVLVGILPRSAALSISQAAFNAARATVNADLAANWATHADAFVDVRGITNLGADGDSANLTYYADAIHPTDAGHALLAPSVTAAVLALL